MYFVTSNENKFKEVSQILSTPLERIELDLKEIQSVEAEEVVKEKAKEAFKETGKPAIVEDTALYIDSLNGLPGALVKWFLEALDSCGIMNLAKGSPATAETVVGYFDGENVHTFKGQLKGKIADYCAESGFGWDTIFIPEGKDKTLAEIEDKNEISHRAKAFKAFEVFLTTKD